MAREFHSENNKKVVSLFEDTVEDELQRSLEKALNEHAKCKESLAKVSSTYPDLPFNNDKDVQTVTVDTNEYFFDVDVLLEKRGVDTFHCVFDDPGDENTCTVVEYTRDFEVVRSFTMVEEDESHALFFGKPVVVNPDKEYEETDDLISITSCKEILNLHRNENGIVTCDTAVTYNDKICNVVHFGGEPFKVIQRTSYLYSVVILINMETNETFKYLIKHREEDYYWIDIVRMGGQFCFIDLFTGDDNEAYAEFVQCNNGKVIHKVHGFTENIVTCRDFVACVIRDRQVLILSW